MNEVSDLTRATARTGTTLGIAVVILGLLAIFAPMMSGLAIGMIVAVLIIAAGIGQLIFAFQSKTFGEGLTRFLWGGLSVLAGGFMLARPLHGLATMTLILGIFFIVEGIARIFAAFQIKPEKGWGWLVFNGLVAFVLAYLILREWPLSGTWAIGVLAGVHLLFQGWYMIMFGSVGAVAADELESEGA